MRSTETFILANAVSGALVGAAQKVVGGKYGLSVFGTPGTSNLQVLDQAGNWNSYTTALATGYSVVDLPSGQVRANLGSAASGATVTISRIPND